MPSPSGPLSFPGRCTTKHLYLCVCVLGREGGSASWCCSVQFAKGPGAPSHLSSCGLIISSPVCMSRAIVMRPYTIHQRRPSALMISLLMHLFLALLPLQPWQHRWLAHGLRPDSGYTTRAFLFPHRALLPRQPSGCTSARSRCHPVAVRDVL